MPATSYRNDSWRRLPWLLPLATLVAFLLLMGFLRLLVGSDRVSPVPARVELEMVELPPTPAPEPAAVTPPAPAPSPPPKAVEPEPTTEVKPEAPPKPPSPRRRAVPPKPAPTPPSTAPAPLPTTVPAPAPVTPAPPGGATMGARVLYQPMPEIPAELRRRALELSAEARFHIAVNGSAEVELIEPTPDPLLNRALLDALRKWRFFPALENGRPVASSMDLRIPLSVR